MALFTDTSPADIELLVRYESGIPELARTEGINLDSKLWVTQLEIADRIMNFLSRQAPTTNDGRRINRSVEGVVITPALRRWHAFVALDAIYRDGYGTQSNDRYAVKSREYRTAAERAAMEYFQLGVPMVDLPVRMGVPPSAPAATPDATLYWAQMTLVDGRGVEGAPSRPVLVALTPGMPVYGPNGFLTNPLPWNLYLGLTREKMTRQNAAPLGAQEDWIFPGAVADGPVAGDGQAPDYYITSQQTMTRG